MKISIYFSHVKASSMIKLISAIHKKISQVDTVSTVDTELGGNYAGKMASDFGSLVSLA